MKPSPTRVALAVLLVTLMVASSLGIAGTALLSGSTAGSGASTPAVASPSGSASAPAPSASVVGPQATPQQQAEAAEVGHITPAYTYSPAPMGLAEYGLRSGPNGSIQPFILNTTSIRGTFDPASFNGPNATDLLSFKPDGYGVQLNAVLTNVTLFGNDKYEFWTQNVVNYYPYSGMMDLQTNIWNWSAGSGGDAISSNVFLSHGPHGNLTSMLYAAILNPVHIAYPFNLTLTMASEVVGGRDAVYFSVNVTSPSGDVNEPDWDYAVFNSLAGTTPPLTVAANYTADGYQYDALGHTNDFELTIGGASDGRQTSFLTADATETLDYWNASAGAYEAIPSAYSYGSETGETSIGATISWATGANGQPYGVVSTGPSLLGGLWNASSPSGGPGQLTISVEPSNAFLFLRYTASSAFNISENEWVPTVHSNSFTIPSGSFGLEIELSDYDPLVLGNLTVSPGAPITIVESLTRNMSQGIYTPLWAWSNAQIANLSTAGSGTQSHPYVIENNQEAPLEFSEYNDLGYLVFPGVYFIGTTAYTTFVDPASMASDSPGDPNIPTNDLPWWFYDDANVAVEDASNISGWFIATPLNTPYALSAVTFNVIVWNSSGFLFANDSFQSQADALLFIGGTDNFVWGCTFTELNAPESILPYAIPFSDGNGISAYASGDTFYNNRFVNVPETASSQPIDLYALVPIPTDYVNTWNITPQPATNVHYAPNWPSFPLTGSIIGTSTQGGNFWWDYGLVSTLWGTSNPYSVLPYNESRSIASGGDYAPLLYSPLYRITLAPSGLPGDVGWGLRVTAAAEPFEDYAINASVPAGTSVVVELTSAPFSDYVVGAYALRSGYTAPTVTFAVTENGSVTVAFAPVFTVTFRETGLASHAQWSVTLNGTFVQGQNSEIAFYSLPNGTYAFTVGSVVGFTASPSEGNATVAGGNLVVPVTFSPLYAVTFFESGLPSRTSWSVTVGTQSLSGTTDTIVLLLDNGSYSYSVPTLGPWLPSPTASGSFTVNGAPVEVNITFVFTSTVTFSQSGIPNGTTWTTEVTETVLGIDGSVSGTSWFVNSTGPTAVFELVNGSYSYTITAMGYTTESGSLNVTGHTQTIPVTISTPSSGAAPLAWWIWALIIAVFAVVVVVVLVLALRRRSP